MARKTTDDPPLRLIDGGKKGARKTTQQVDDELDEMRLAQMLGDLPLSAEAKKIVADAEIAQRKVALWDEAAMALDLANSLTSWKTSSQT